MNRQQICAALGVSESTIRRLEHEGLPFTPVGVRSHRYNLEECKTWLKTQYVPAKPARRPATVEAWRKDDEFMAACRRAEIRMAGPAKNND